MMAPLQGDEKTGATAVRQGFIRNSLELLYISLVGAAALAAGFLSYYGTVEFLTSTGDRRMLESLATGAGAALAVLHLLHPGFWWLYSRFAPETFAEPTESQSTIGQSHQE